MEKFKLGKLAAAHDPQNRTLKLAKYMVNVPDPPEAFSNLDIIFNNLHITDPSVLFPIDGNDVYGDCVVAGAAHYLTLEHGRIGQKIIPADNDVIRAYKKLSGCKDQGLVMLDFLKYWRKHPLFGHKIELFGRIELHNPKLVKQCIQLFGGVDLGFLVQNDAITDFESGTPWTPGPSDGGGHCVIAAAYDKNYYYILTWGGIIRATHEWWDKQVDESFAILPTEFKEPGFAQGFDSNQLQTDFETVTNTNLNTDKMRSKFLTLNASDFLKGLIMAFLSALITGLYNLVQTGAFNFDWVTFKPILLVAVAAALSYLIKNLFTNSQGQTFKAEPK